MLLGGGYSGERSAKQKYNRIFIVNSLRRETFKIRDCRSCETQLILTHHQWATALDKGRQVDVVFLDFSKAFDKVNHAVLLQKLRNFGITGSLLQWCESYLSNRRQRVVLDGLSSSWSDGPSKVPQGSLLGPSTWPLGRYQSRRYDAAKSRNRRTERLAGVVELHFRTRYGDKRSLNNSFAYA